MVQHQQGYVPSDPVNVSCFLNDRTDTLRGILLQVEMIRRHIPGFELAPVSDELLEKIRVGAVQLPVGADGWGVMIRWGRRISSNYLTSLQVVVAALEKQRSLESVSWLEQVAEEQVRIFTKTITSFHTLIAGQPAYDILIVPVQNGFREGRIGQSVHDLRQLFKSQGNSTEAPMELINALITVLVDPSFVAREDQVIECGGTYMRGVSTTNSAPYIQRRGTSLRLGLGDSEEGWYGSGVPTFFGF